MKNNNKNIIKKLSNRSLRKNRMRNLVAIAAIALTTLLFTGLFTVGQGMIQLTEEQTMRQVGTRAHSGLKNVTMEQCEKIVDNPLVVSWDYGRIIGFVNNEELIKRNVQIEWTTKENLESSFKAIKEGRLPEQTDEIVLDDIVMQMLGIPKTLGSKVDLSFKFQDQEYKKSFTLCGWYEGDPVAMASSVYVSDAYFKELCDGRTDEDLLQSANETHTQETGLVFANIYFKDSKNIEENTIRLIEEAGYQAGDGSGEIAYGVNWAYLLTKSESVDGVTLGILIVIVLVILASGYLIIYNIFQISIRKDIRFYGLLKTVGTTKKQIGRLIRRQAMILSIVGIPIGLILGYFVGLGIIPTIFSMVQENSSNFHMKFSPFIFIFSTIFSIITVAISCYKPGKIAGKVSPIEATKYQEVMVKVKGNQKRKKFGVAAMAYSNLKRNKKKTLLVVLSLSMSVIILEEIVTFSKCFNISKYLEASLVDDITISSANLTNYSSASSDFSIDEDYLNYVKSLDGIERLDEMYTTDDSRFHYLSEEAHGRYVDLYEQEMLYDAHYTHEAIQSVVEDNTSIDETRYAYSEELLSSLKVEEGTIDLEKFRTGDYVILGNIQELNQSFYHPGDKIILRYPNEKSEFFYSEGEFLSLDMHFDPVVEKEYEVMAVVDIPGSLTTGRYAMNALTTILPIEELEKMDDSMMLFCVGIKADESKIEAMEDQIEQYTKNVNPLMDYVSKAQLSKEFGDITKGYLIIGGAIAFVIGLIGILNFVNTMMTNVISRQRELAMLSSIGLTNSQLKKMLVFEGIYYILFTMGVSVILGSIISVLFINALGNIMEYFVYQFVATPYLVVFPILLVVAYLVPYIAYRNTKKHSIVESLRENE